jgi:branched-chain amino acid transport system permease protein
MRSLQIISIALLIIVLVCLPLVIEKDSTINLFILVFLYVALASSWNILGGFTGQTSLGHAAFFGLGALATRLLWIDGFPIFTKHSSRRAPGSGLRIVDRGSFFQA